MAERSRKHTGLGANAFFMPLEKPPGEQEPEQEPQPATPTQRPTRAAKPPKPKQTRMTIMFYDDDLELLENFQRRLRRETGKRVSISKILRDALRKEAKRQGVSTETAEHVNT